MQQPYIQVLAGVTQVPNWPSEVATPFIDYTHNPTVC